MKEDKGRRNKALLICDRMQKDLDKLKDMNFTLDSRYESISIFDNKIKPQLIGSEWFEKDEDYGNQVVFTFDCTHYENKNT